MTQPAPVEDLTPAAGRLGRLGVAVIAAILAGPPARSSGCARCGAPTPALNTAPSVQSASPVRPKHLASREARPKRLMGELKIASGGSYLVCVRACDGGFFPVSYVGDRNSLAKICQALCPNAETQLYSMPFGGTIEDSVSMSGMPYGMLPNAGKFEQAFDQSCSCRRKDQSWAEALAAIEARLQRHPGDILVTPEISERMSRPAAAAPRSASRRPAPPMLTLSRSSRNPSRSRWFSTPMAWTRTCTRRPRRSLARHQALAWKRQAAHTTASSRARSWSSRAPTVRSCACGSLRRYFTSDARCGQRPPSLIAERSKY